MAKNLVNKSDVQNSSRVVSDLFLTQEKFELRKNEIDGYLETFPQPENLDRYYESENYISHTDSNLSAFEKVYQFIKNYNIQYKLKLIQPKNSTPKLLDYGCGVGDFLEQAKKKNYQVFGVEPNPKARKIAQTKLGQNQISSSSIYEMNELFDVITLWHVLEHIPELEKFIPSLKDRLKDDGKLFIAVPNFESHDAKFYQEFWAAYDVPRHLWHFSPDSFENLFHRFGMKIEKRHPLWFDSYYVSLLSEKYKKNSFGPLRAIIVATWSNLKGIFTGNYSSVVYQISKNRI